MREAPAGEVCLDTSVWVKVWLPEEGSDLAQDFLTAVLDRNWGLLAPPTLAYEVASVLRGRVRSRRLSATAAHAVWTDFRQYPVSVDTRPDLPDRAWALAERLGLPTAYDAAFLATAGSRPFVTADGPLLEACHRVPGVCAVALAVARKTVLGAY